MSPSRQDLVSDVLDLLTDLIIEHCTPEYTRSDNGPEFFAKHLVYWLDESNVNA